MPRAPRAAAQPAADLPPVDPAAATAQAEADRAEIAKLTTDYLRAAEEIKRWEEYKRSITTRMTALHAAGKLATKFPQHGYTFSLVDGRRSITPDTIGKGQLEALKLDLLAQGHATESFGAPYWTTHKLKAPRDQEQLTAES